MCGIAGALLHSYEFDAGAVKRDLVAMCDQVAHRGPDAAGAEIVGRAALGHRRLAIVDLNPRARQPMSTTDGGVWVIFNGEIYNFGQLRRELESKGYRFRTTSDTEVLLHGWREWGEYLVQRLRGMFAFAIWDSHDETLLLARDRLGKKPLFYSDQSDALLFCSEPRSLLQWPTFVRSVDMEVVHDYLTFGYCIGNSSIFSGVRKLPPAHYLLVRRGHAPRLELYWRQRGIDKSLERSSIEHLSKELVERLDEAIRVRLMGDVPLGAFLSGGVDSSAVVARLAPMLSTRLRTFSAGFNIDGFDETPYARRVARRFDTEHYSFIMGHDLINALPTLIWHYGEPYADSSAIVTYALSREIRRFVTVALTGDGGDEVFLGYSRYRRLLGEVRNLRDGTSLLPTYTYPTMHDDPLGRRVRDIYARTVAGFREEHKLMGYGPNLSDFLFTSSNDLLGPGLEDATEDNAMDACARVELSTYLPGDLLVKADIATMAVGLEGRSPFLDHEMADWAGSLPQGRRVFERNGHLETKALLKRAMEPHLPADVLYRPKQGFSVPMKHWLQRELRDLSIDLLLSRQFLDRGLFTESFVRYMLERHNSGHEDHGKRIWQLVCLELWFQTFIDRTSATALDLNLGHTGHMSADIAIGSD